MLDFLLLTSAELIANSGVLAAFATAIAIIALSFMAGEGLSMPPVKGFAKTEAYELGVSAVILVILLLLITQDGIFDRVTKGFMLPGVPVNRTCDQWASLHGPYNETTQTYAKGSIAFGQADYFLGCRPTLTMIFTGGLAGTDGIMLRKLTLGYQSLMLTEMVIGFLSGFNTNLSIPVLLEPFLTIDVGIVPFIGMSQINDIHTLLVDLVGSVWAAFAAQKLLLQFVEETALPVFLPFGLLLRALPFSRKTGSTIIAVVFAAYFVYPISILINQHLYEAIADPAENPNTPSDFICPSVGAATCCPLNDPCTNDTECCTNNCRYMPSNGSKVCVSPLTDFAEYESIYAVCYGETDQAKIDAELENQANRYNDALTDIYYNVPPSSSSWTQSEGRVRDFSAELWRKINAMKGINEALMLPNPKKVVTASFSEVEVLVMDVSQFAMLGILFIVIEIVITMTLLKDIALLIGGEPRVLGISQLV